MKKIKVSVIMPSLNVAPYIEECIRSVLYQSLKEIEVICIDAGSTDGTVEILKKYEKADQRMKIVNFGVKSYGAQVNYGILAAQGEYIAILETDDFIEAKMYETLYCAAEEHHADYAKADFKKFFVLKSGEYLYSTVNLFEHEKTEFYGKLINPHSMDDLYKADYNIWKGIYKRDFLIQNHIFLNESAGASYQDIGFMEKVMAAARRAVYLNQPFYHYRMDRNDASSYSIHSLKNTQFEFQKLLEYFEGKENIYWRGIYLHMMTAFFNEYEKTLKKTGFAFESPACSNYYFWFIDKITQAIKEHFISTEDMEKKYWEKFKLLLKSPSAFAEFLKSEKSRCRVYADNLNFDYPTQILIFGAGHWGYETLKLMREKKNCQIQAFIDNDEGKQGMLVENLKICSLKEALCQFPDAFLFIANEKYYPEIRMQIEKEGQGHKILCPFE